MSQSETLQCSLRTKTGSRESRKLRAQGRVPACLNSEGADAQHVDLHVDEHTFLASRRHHVHLYDLDIEGKVEAAVVRHLDWDALGDRLVHIEFKRVVRGVETESEVDLVFSGMVKDGILSHSVNEILVRCLPSVIPDSIKVVVDGLGIGTHLRAKDLVLPAGVSLAVDPELEIAVVTAVRHEAAETTEEGEGAAPGA